VLVGADSHITSAGALGMFATGAGGLEVAVAMAGYGFDLPCPRVVGVELTGALAPGVEPKDVILDAAARLARRRHRRRAQLRATVTCQSATWPYHQRFGELPSETARRRAG
jgi:homoaconitase/3-isopropylmalate dehydratase large subunit